MQGLLRSSEMEVIAQSEKNTGRPDTGFIGVTDLRALRCTIKEDGPKGQCSALGFSLQLIFSPSPSGSSLPFLPWVLGS